MSRALTITIAAIVALLAVCAPALAQGTPMPNPLIQWFANDGTVANAYGMCVFRAGTSTLATTYTTAALTVANSNPIIMNEAGRATSGGVFLTPGESYKFVYKDSTVTTCSPDTGVTLWTVDNVSATPSSSANIDVTLTAAVSFTAGELAYISDGSASLNAGQAYKADADLSYAGPLPFLGFAVNNVTAGSSGSFRIAGTMTGLTGLSTGADYYVSGTAGAITSTAPVMARLIGRATSATTLQVQPNPRSTPIKPRAPCGRLTLTTNTPVTTADVTAATTVYFTPYGGCSNVTLYDGTAYWYQQDFTQVSIAVPATTSQMYDVFGYDNAGTFTLELTAWTNDTTRATALTTQNGVYVKTGATTRLYLGSFRTTGVSGQTEDSVTKRYLWNYYNRVPRQLQRYESTASWTYTTATVRQANGSTANQIDVVVGVAEVAVDLTLNVLTSNSTGGVGATAGIGEDSTTTFVDGAYMQGAAAIPTMGTVRVVKSPAVGKHSYSWNEWSTATGTSTWFGSIAAVGSTVQFGLSGWILG